MPVNTRHPAYEKAIEKIELTEAAVEGEVQSEDFVPRLSEQSKAAWRAMVNRAAYFNVTERSLLALVGALLRKPYSITGLVGDVPVVDETNFDEFMQRAYRTLLIQGRLGLHVDFDEARNTPKLIAYSAEHIINWCDRFVVIEESVLEADEDDPFVLRSIPQWRELRLNEDDVYEVRLWRQVGRGKTFQVIDTRVPTVRGRPLTTLPFWFVTPYDNTDELHTPPLHSLAALNVQHFRLSVDHCHGLHFTALPQPWISGDLYIPNSDPNAAPQKLAIGTDRVWHLSTGSTAGYLEFTGSGLAAVRDKLKDVEEQMFTAGSRLLTHKAGVESAEALQLRSGSESAALVTLAMALETALQGALTVYNEWAGSLVEPEVALNRDFTAAVLDPGQIKALLEMYAAGTLTLDSLLQRLYEGELVDDVDAEKAALTAEAQPPAPTEVDPGESITATQ